MIRSASQHFARASSLTVAKAPQAGVASPAAGFDIPAQGKLVMKNSVHIMHMKWREGRPCFAPSPRLYALGYKGRDLKHPDGKWYSHEETTTESNRIIAEAASQIPTGHCSSNKHADRQNIISLSQLVEKLFSLPEFQSREIKDGKKIRKGLSAATVKGYRSNARTVEQAAARLAAKKGGESLWLSPAALWSPTIANAILHEIESHSGLHTARACRTFMSQLWSRLAAKEAGVNKTLWSEIDKLPVPEGRVRPWEPAEFMHMVRTADEMGRSDVGDLITFGAFTSQRQTDRLGWHSAVDHGTHIIGKQQKRGKNVRIYKLPLLTFRLEAAKQRRLAHKVQWPHLFIDEQAQKPWAIEGDWYRHVFARIRAKAAETMPSCATLRDQDLKDTNQTWLDRAGADPDVMARVAGHDPISAAQLQKQHYVAENTARQDAAVLMVGVYLEGKI